MKKKKRHVATISKKNGLPLYRVFLTDIGRGKHKKTVIKVKKEDCIHPGEKYGVTRGKHKSTLSIHRTVRGERKKTPVCTVMLTKDSRFKLIQYDPEFSASIEKTGIPAIVFTKLPGMRMLR